MCSYSDIHIIIEAKKILASGVSDLQRNQILGHAKSETFLKHYLSANVVVDVQSIFLGQASKSDLIKEVGKLCLRRDANLPQRLTSAQKAQACREQPEFEDLTRQINSLGTTLKNEYGGIKKGNDSENGKERKKAEYKLHAMKMRAEREALEKLLREFHNTAA